MFGQKSTVFVKWNDSLFDVHYYQFAILTMPAMCVCALCAWTRQCSAQCNFYIYKFTHMITMWTQQNLGNKNNAVRYSSHSCRVVQGVVNATIYFVGQALNQHETEK